MNEPLFKNTFVRDEQAIKEIYANYYLKSTRFRIIYLLYSLLVLMSFVVSLDSGNYSYLMLYLVFGTVIALLISFSYHQSVKISIMRDKELSNGENMLMELTVYDDKIELINSGNKQTVDFSSIHRVCVTKNYINVFTKAKFIYTFKKDSFTLGRYEDFIEFLKSKGIKIQK